MPTTGNFCLILATPIAGIRATRPLGSTIEKVREKGGMIDSVYKREKESAVVQHSQETEGLDAKINFRLLCL